MRQLSKTKTLSEKANHLITDGTKRMYMTWSMGIMSDSLSNERTFRTFNLLDDYYREALSVP